MSGGSATPTTRVRAPHLYEVDVVRILTFACVIAVHTTSHTVDTHDIWLNGLLALVHFTREVFFALSGFVLVYSYLSRPVPMRRFWPRRFLLVGVPYVVWSAVYFIASNLHSWHGTILAAAGRFLQHLVTGTAWYHLYFLLVTMQVYLLVPLIVWLVKKTRGHHLAVLIVAGVYQLLITGVYRYWTDKPDWLGTYDKAFFFSYLFFIIAGAIAADHVKSLFGWVARHRPLIGWLTLAAAAMMIGVYLLEIGRGTSYYRAGTPLQPAEMVWSLAVAFGFLAVGSWWAERRRPGSFVARGVDVASDRSFGIFLSHPLVIWLALWVGDDWLERTVPKPWLTLVTYVLAVVGAAIITEVARRSPVSLAFTGRPRMKRGAPSAAAVAEAVPPR